MANYPAVPITIGSTRDPINTAQVDIMGSGRPRVRNRQTVESFKFKVIHRYISQADAEALYAFWSANKTSNILLTWVDGQVYSCSFTAPTHIDKMQGGYWLAESYLIGVLDV